MSTAFQSNAFQNNAFQIVAAVTKRITGMEPERDGRILRDDEEVTRLTAMFITLLDS